MAVQLDLDFYLEVALKGEAAAAEAKTVLILLVQAAVKSVAYVCLCKQAADL